MNLKKIKEDNEPLRGLILSPRTKARIYKRLEKDGLFVQVRGKFVYICERRRYAQSEQGFVCVRTEYGLITDVGQDDPVYTLRDQLITRDQEAKIRKFEEALDRVEKEKLYQLEEAQGEFRDDAMSMMRAKNSIYMNGLTIPTSKSKGGIITPTQTGITVARAGVQKK